ncbi:MAG: dethiobiotin synthase [Alphaproteobacteria bacterium]|jgi:dethiobiotin synthetase
MPAVFVTASGTDIGKTYVAEALLGQWRASGRTVAVLKPILSGYDPAEAAGSDTGRLLTASGVEITPESIDLVSPWRYAAPLSPDMAAAREGRNVPVDDVIAYCAAAIAESDEVGMSLLIEGIGGVMVPLDETRTVADLIAALGIPAILVGGSYLGSLSHTMTAYEALRSRNIAVDCIIISETPDSDVPLAETRDVLARFVQSAPVEVMPFVP